MVDLIFFVCSLSSLYYPVVCSHRDLILYTITVRKITAVQAPCYIYRHQNYKHNSNFIPKTFANLIEPKMWPLCMARNGGPSPVGLGPQLALNITYGSALRLGPNRKAAVHGLPKKSKRRRALLVLPPPPKLDFPEGEKLCYDWKTSTAPVAMGAQPPLPLHRL